MAVLIILLWILEQSVCHCPVIRAYESDDEVVDKLHAKTGICVACVLLFNCSNFYCIEHCISYIGLACGYLYSLSLSDIQKCTLSPFHTHRHTHSLSVPPPPPPHTHTK